MSDIQVLVANEPRVYREAIAAALQEMRPGIATIAVDPADLAKGIEQHHPELTMCSQLITDVETEAPTWILLYPECDGCAVISVAGKQQMTDHLTLADLVAVVDRTAQARPHLGLRELHHPPFPPPQ